MTTGRLAVVAIALVLTAGACASSGPSASTRAAGRRWLAAHGRAWAQREVAVRLQAERVLGRSGNGPVVDDPGGPVAMPDASDTATTTSPTALPASGPSTLGPAKDLVDWCRGAHGPSALGAPPFPAADVREAMGRVTMSEVFKACAEPNLSLARQLAHRQVDHLSHVDQLLAEYR